MLTDHQVGRSKYGTRGSSCFTVVCVKQITPSFYQSSRRFNIVLQAWIELTNIHGVQTLLKIKRLCLRGYKYAFPAYEKQQPTNNKNPSRSILQTWYIQLYNIIAVWPTLHKPNEANKGFKPLLAILYLSQSCSNVISSVLSHISFKEHVFVTRRRTRMRYVQNLD